MSQINQQTNSTSFSHGWLVDRTPRQPEDEHKTKRLGTLTQATKLASVQIPFIFYFSSSSKEVKKHSSITAQAETSKSQQKELFISEANKKKAVKNL